jgi:5-methyltetrahydropteroyltriglutamate--homocysteine methyltransferase
MMETCDVGSLPVPGEERKLEEGRRKYAREEGGEEAEYFEQVVVSSFLDKVRCGITLPNYPQFSDMISSFLEPLRGVRRKGEGYVLEEEPSLRTGEEVLPELKALLRNSGRVKEGGGERMKVCLTGPYTLSSLFSGWDETLFTLLSRPLARLVPENLPRGKGLRVELFSLDEPVFGRDDPRLDRGSEGREVLLKAWEEVLGAARRKGVKTLLHLHQTSDGLFWELENLDGVESHVEDPLYSSPETPRLLERRDKFLKVSITRTDFDRLVERRVGTGEKVGEVWKGIREGRVRAEEYLEGEEEMGLRLRRAVERFGERVAYAGPECGLRGFPTYESALECLRRVARAVNRFSG